MIDLVNELEERYGTIEHPVESLTEDGISIISYVEENNIVSKKIDKTQSIKTTLISTTPIDFSLDITSLDDCGDYPMLPHSKITLISEQGETEDFKSKKTTSEFINVDDYMLGKPVSIIEETTKQQNDILVHTDVTRKFNPVSFDTYFIEIHKHFVDDLSFTSVSDHLQNQSDAKLVKNYSKKITLEKTTDDPMELTEETANYKTIEKELDFTLGDNATKSLFRDSSFKEYVKSQDGEYHILNQSTRVVKRGDVDEFLIEDDNLIFVSGGFLNYLQGKNIVDENESINTLKQYVDEIGATTSIFQEESNTEILSEVLDDFTM